MGQPFIGEVRMAGFNYTPIGYLPCDGSLVSISAAPALFQLLGTTYGGDGQTTFGVPNLQSRVVIHQGDDGNGNTYTLGQSVGVESVTLTTPQMGAHTHAFLGSAAGGNVSMPKDAYPAGKIGGGFYSVDTVPGNLTPLASNSTASTGGGLSHNNLMPYLCVNFVIAYEGVYPSQG